MSEFGSSGPSADGPLGRWLEALARAFALGGGAILVAMTVMETVSISLRALAGAPIPGDFELIKMGTAIAVVAFLPYCQLVKGNFIVDFVLARAPERVRSAMDALGDLLLGIIAAVLLWRMTLGGIDLRASADKSMVLSMPVWSAFPPILLSLALLVVVSGYVFWRDFKAAVR